MTNILKEILGFFIKKEREKQIKLKEEYERLLKENELLEKMINEK